MRTRDKLAAELRKVAALGSAIVRERPRGPEERDLLPPAAAMPAGEGAVRDWMIIQSRYRRRRARTSPEPAIAKVCAKHGCTFAGLVGKCRARRISAPRQELMFRLRLDGWSLSEIGNLLGRHHGTVLHGIRRAEHRLSTYPRTVNIPVGRMTNALRGRPPVHSLGVASSKEGSDA